MADPYAAFSSPVATDPYAAFSSPDKAPSAAAPQATLKQGGTSPTEWLTEKIAPVISHIPGIGSSDERTNYQRAKQLAGVANMIPFWGSAEPAYQAVQNVSAIGPELGRGEYGNAALSTGAAGLNTAASLAASLPFIGKPAQTVLATGAGKLIGALRLGAGEVPGMVQQASKAIASVIPESQTTKATKIADLLKGDVTQTLSKTANANITAAQEAHDTAAAALADAQRVPTPTSIGIGEPREMTELGTPAKTGGVDAKQAMVDAQHQMDSVLRPKQAEIVADNEANGIKFVDTPAIQELIAKIEPIVKPNVTTASATTNVTDPLTKSLYRRVYNSLISKEVDLTAEEAASAKANNLPVQEITDPVTGQTTYKRTFDSSFQAAENLRRYLGDAFNKDTGAYGAINDNIKKDMYALLDKAQTEYVGAAHTDLQKSYAAFTKDLKPYEETTIGKQLTGTQGSTDIPSYTPADISKILLTGDRSKIDQIFKLAASKDRPAIKQSIADAIETAVNGKNREAVAEMTKTGSPLSDILEHPELKEFRAPINNYVTRLGDAEQAAVTTKNLDLGTFKTGVSEAEKAGRATDVTINDINNAPVKDLPNLLSTHINKLYTDGKFSPEQFKSASEEIKSISKTFDKSQARSKAIAAFKKHVLMAAAVGAAGTAGGGAIYKGYKYVLGE
jgi:hypothetical protein